jgi:hypothetical protein
MRVSSSTCTRRLPSQSPSQSPLAVEFRSSPSSAEKTKSDAGVGIPAAGWDGMQRRVNAANGTPKIETSLFRVLADSDIVTTFGSTVFESN